MEDTTSGAEAHLERTDDILPDEDIATDPVFLSNSVSSCLRIAAFCLIGLVFYAILTLV